MLSYNDPKVCPSISTVVFDYGGVLAEEGFRDGLLAIARMSDLDGPSFFQMATDAIYETGYLTGISSEKYYWDSIRNISGIDLTDSLMKHEIMSRFTLRAPMIELARLLRGKGLKIVVLSDQTNWLDELDARDHFFQEFHSVLNSYYLGKGKRDVTIFQDLVATLAQDPASVLFIDDNEGHTQRARSLGIQTITFTNVTTLLESLRSMSVITDSEADRIISG